MTMQEDNVRSEKVIFTMSLPAETANAIDRLAHEETISRAAWIRRLVIGVARNLKAEATA